MPSARLAARLDRTLAALADPHRRRVVDLLGRAPSSAGELAIDVGLSPAALSRHLKTLKTAGLVAESPAKDDARVRVYRLQPKLLAALMAWLAATEPSWSEQLSAPDPARTARR